MLPFEPALPGLVANDQALMPYLGQITDRLYRYRGMMHYIEKHSGSIYQFAGLHHYFGLHYSESDRGWYYREWAPHAYSVCITGDFNWWDRKSHPLKLNRQNVWEIFLDDATYSQSFVHGSLFKVVITSRTYSGDRIPAYAFRVVQNDETKDFSAQVWKSTKYKWKNDSPIENGISEVLIYEAHTGMAQEKEAVGSWLEFADNILPRIQKAGYTVVQLMAVQEHPYYGSYGYHVSSFFAPSSRFGTPEDLKYLIDKAHNMGLAVIMDLVHSHSVKNVNEGLNIFDGSEDLYFYPGERGTHPLWDSKIFNYGKWEVQQFLLSNIRYWLEEFNLDGFRFDGVTSMLYENHGLNYNFLSLDDYFTNNTNTDAVLYLQLANTLVHKVKPNAISIAEDVSGMPGVGVEPSEGGLGFDFRLGMGIPDHWINLVKNIPDENWNMHEIWTMLVNRRMDEKTVAYVESHDQALVGDQTLSFRLMGTSLYSDMVIGKDNLLIERGMALHKMIRLITLALGGEAWLNFMGNEFGHPDWIDFPREGNDWSYKYAKRQWSLADSDLLKYQFLNRFDQAIIALAKLVKLVSSTYTQLCQIDDENKVIAFCRRNLLFAFNFNVNKSLTDYKITLPEPASYHLILDSDDTEFGGLGRVIPVNEYFSDEKGFLSVYLPNRTALVFKKVNDKNHY